MAVDPFAQDSHPGAASDRARLLAHGAAGGLFAGVAVILVFLTYDFFRLDPLGTPMLIARALHAPMDASPQLIAASRVADIILIARSLVTYAVFHFGVFAALGAGAAVLFERVGVAKNLLTGALYGLIACSAVFYTGNAMVGGGVLEAPDWRIVLLANAIAGIVMVAHLLGDDEAPSGGAA